MSSVSRRVVLAGIGAGFAVPLFAAGSPIFAAGPGKLEVVTTTGMIADAARQVAGSRANVRSLMGPGVDPHGYRQTRSDILALTRADLVLWHGLYLEAQLEEFLQALAKRKPVRAVGEAVPRSERIAHDDYPDRFDPHVWMDPRLWRYVVMAVRDALIERDPDGAADYRDNAERHLAELERLATYAEQSLSSVPEKRRILLTAHDAFNYFGRAHGYRVEGIQGISTESEAGLRRVQELVDLIVQTGLSAVFVESSVADRNVRALIEGASARGANVVIGGELYSDAMGADKSYEGTYVGMIDHNVTVIARALGGDAPERGLHTRLAKAAVAVRT